MEFKTTPHESESRPKITWDGFGAMSPLVQKRWGAFIRDFCLPLIPGSVQTDCAVDRKRINSVTISIRAASKIITQKGKQNKKKEYG